MATYEFHYDQDKEEGVITFRIPDKEVQSAALGLLSQMAIKMNNESGGVAAAALNLLIILEGIEEAQMIEKRRASQQN